MAQQKLAETCDAGLRTYCTAAHAKSRVLETLETLKPHHGLKDQAQVAPELEVRQQADDVAAAVGVCRRQLAQDDPLRLAGLHSDDMEIKASAPPVPALRQHQPDRKHRLGLCWLAEPPPNVRDPETGPAAQRAKPSGHGTGRAHIKASFNVQLICQGR